MILTYVTLPPAQLLEESLQGHCPGGEDPAGCIWHKFSHNDLGYPVVKAPPLPALGNSAVPGAFTSVPTPFFFGGGERNKRGLHNYLLISEITVFLYNCSMAQFFWVVILFLEVS